MNQPGELWWGSPQILSKPAYHFPRDHLPPSLRCSYSISPLCGLFSLPSFIHAVRGLNIRPWNQEDLIILWRQFSQISSRVFFLFLCQSVIYRRVIKHIKKIISILPCSKWTDWSEQGFPGLACFPHPDLLLFLLQAECCRWTQAVCLFAPCLCIPTGGNTACALSPVPQPGDLESQFYLLLPILNPLSMSQLLEENADD